MQRWAVMFPGQGSQFVGMGEAFFRRDSVAKLAFEEADDALGYSLSKIIFHGPKEALEDTEVQQPAILVTSLAMWRVLRHERPFFKPALGMGLSLGEYSAYVAAGAMPFIDAVRVTRVRGRAMQNTVPKGLGSMMAVMGLDSEKIHIVCQEASRVAVVEPANYNAPGQIVVSGYVAGLERAEQLVREQGGRAVRLAVSAPFHSSLLKPAEPILEEALSGVPLGKAEFPIVANVDSAWCEEPHDFVPRLIQQVSSPILFEAGVRQAISAGVTHFLEIGPGKSLTALVRKIDRGVTTVSVQDPDGLHKALELL